MKYLKYKLKHVDIANQWPSADWTTITIYNHKLCGLCFSNKYCRDASFWLSVLVADRVLNHGCRCWRSLILVSQSVMFNHARSWLIMVKTAYFIIVNNDNSWFHTIDINSGEWWWTRLNDGQQWLMIVNTGSWWLFPLMLTVACGHLLHVPGGNALIGKRWKKDWQTNQLDATGSKSIWHSHLGVA